jgi:hypothetical protein
VVTSRAFATGGPQKPRSLLPLIDICNHSFAPNCDIDKRQAGSIVLYTKQPIKKGSELLLSYGALDNHTLLLDYGFLDADNPYDHMTLSFDVEQLQVRLCKLAQLSRCSSPPPAILPVAAALPAAGYSRLCSQDTAHPHCLAKAAPGSSKAAWRQCQSSNRHW